MLWAVAMILLFLWALAVVSSYTLGGLIHILIVAAFIVAAIELIRDRNRPRPSPFPRYERKSQ